MSHNEVRETFLEFFEKKGHKRVRSASLIPHGDPTLMFTNAGMNQFKNLFIGLENRDYKRATTSQKCLRVTGKHNDFEEVGRTARHHTFFEMLGNFSFGDYFKRQAITYAWELFTEVFKLDVDRLYATVYLDDDEAYDIWEKEIGFPSERIYRLGEADNYWSMGPTGPNGPCSELHYDMNPPEGRVRTAEEIEIGGDDSFVELWNLVFMQFNTDENGVKNLLPNPSIDTGAGLERVTAVMQNVISNYDTDLFMPYINAIADLANVNYGSEKEPERSVSCRVIADHLRSSSFLIADGILPSNEGRGYVLRRIIRRAIRHGRMLGVTDPFLSKYTELVAREMSDIYPELLESKGYLAKVVHAEERRFGLSFENSYKYFLHEGIEAAKENGIIVVPGEIVFKAYDTFGMPYDLASEIASEHGMTLDDAGYQELMEGQRKKARAAWKGSGEEKADPVFHKVIDQSGATEFLGYTEGIAEGAKVIALVTDAGEVKEIAAGAKGKVVLDKTPFYAESGGQVGDKGTLTADGLVAHVFNTVKVEGKLHVHLVKVEGNALKLGDVVKAEIDSDRRAAVERNHTVTHVMQWVLKDLLGDHVKQAGSLVAADKVRFDFSHFSAMEPSEIAVFERAVNKKIRENGIVSSEEKSLDDALNEGVTALFGEKYGDEVRVVRTGDFSSELCGGTHVNAAGDIGLFHVISESSVAAGVRRIEAVTGEEAVRKVQDERELTNHIAGIFRTTPEGTVDAARKLLDENKALNKELEHLRMKLASAGSGSGGTPYEIAEVGPYKIATQKTSGLNTGTMKNLADEIRSKIKSGAVLLGDDTDGKATLVLAATEDVKDRVNCGKLIKEIGKLIKGGGGGSPTMAQAGGKDAAAIPDSLVKGRDIIAEKLK